MTDRSIAEKLKYKPGMHAFLAHVPSGVDLGIGPEDVVNDPAKADFILVFAENQAEVEERMRAFAPAVRDQTLTWVGYPKGSKAAGRDISRDTIWRFAETVGLILNANFAIDEVWSAVRMRPRRPGE